MSVDDEIRFERRGGLVVVILNRPRALNALSLSMCQALDAGLAEWQADPAVDAVLIKGDGRARVLRRRRPSLPSTGRWSARASNRLCTSTRSNIR